MLLVPIESEAISLIFNFKTPIKYEVVKQIDESKA